MNIEELRMKHEFSRLRNQFYQDIPYFWPDIYDTEYALFDIYRVEQQEINQLREATRNVGKIFTKTAHLLRNANDDLYQSLGIPKETMSIIRLKYTEPESIIARMDFVKTVEGFKLLELNADTPTFIMECFFVNGMVAKEFGLRDPNQDMEILLNRTMQRAVEESVEWLQSDHPNLVFTAHDDHLEDWNTSRYLKELIDYPAKLIPLHQLRIDEEGLYDSNGNKIDILYRQTYPLEHLIHDQNEDGTKVGFMLFDLVQQKKLAILNPPSAFLLQSKAVQAAIWSMYKQGVFFGEIERSWIQKYFLPTYLEQDIFLQNQEKFVKKPSFGREGDTIKIFDTKGKVLLSSERETYDDELPVYQKYVKVPLTKVRTEEGIKNAHFIYGSFWVGGQPSAIGIRAGSAITGNESYYLPVGINEE